MATPLVTREEWGARPARSVTRRDLTMLTAHYGGPSPWGASADRSTPEAFAATTDHARCASIVRAYQAFHLDSRGWSDIAYSSLVCPHGWRFEGRGRDVRTAAQGTTAGNDTSHATCYIAGDGDPLTDEAKAAFADESRRLDGLRRGHRDWKATACPGDPLYTWVHGGQAVPGAPPPDTPAPTEDDDMPLIIAAEKKPAALLSGNEMVPFADADPTLRNLVAAGVRVVHVSPRDYDLFNKGFSQSNAAAEAKLAEIAKVTGAIGMYAAALHNIELAEHERATTTPE